MRPSIEQGLSSAQQLSAEATGRSQISFNDPILGDWIASAKDLPKVLSTCWPEFPDPTMAAKTPVPLLS
jgi:hypothetical protein